MSPPVESDVLTQFPIRVRWHGWEADTWTLKKGGWTICANECRSNFSSEYGITITAHSPHKDLIIGGGIMIPFGLFASQGIRFAQFLSSAVIDMTMHKSSDNIITRFWSDREFSAWSNGLPTDAIATVYESNLKVSDLKVFRYDATPKDIYLSRASLDACLDQMLKLQYPKFQERLRDGGAVIERAEARILLVSDK